MESVAGSAFADDRQRAWSRGGGHGPAVHGGSVEGRLGTSGLDIFPEDPAHGLGELDAFETQGAQRRQHRAAGGLDRNQCHGARQSPDAPPLFSTKRTASITIPRSAAFSMS